jgi:hydroxyacylglutathione hydrolase
MTGLPPKPPNFDRIIARNRARALPARGEPTPLSATQAVEVLAKGGCVLVVRSPDEYGAGHIPGAINVWIESPQFSTRAGWFLPQDAPVVLVAASPTDLTHAVQGLARIGLDDVAGHLQWGMTGWPGEDRAVATVPQISVHDLATMRDERPDLVVVDVREPFEWDDGHIEGARHIPMSEALRRAGELPADRPKAVLCAGGLRSSTVISALSRQGLSNWYNVSGGMTAWVKAGYPTTKAHAAGR